MYSELTYLKTKKNIEIYLKENIVKKEIITCHNIVVKFYADILTMLF